MHKSKTARLAGSETVCDYCASLWQMNPEIVVFDLGKVLVDFDYSIAVSRIAGRSACRRSRSNNSSFIRRCWWTTNPAG